MPTGTKFAKLGKQNVRLRYFGVSPIVVAVGNLPSRGEEIRDDLEDSKNHRSAGRHGNQHVRLCGPQISVRNSSAFNGGGPAGCDNAPDAETVRNIGGHLRKFLARRFRLPTDDCFASFRLPMGGRGVPKRNCNFPFRQAAPVNHPDPQTIQASTVISVSCLVAD
jgi:hypothetical protein